MGILQRLKRWTLGAQGTYYYMPYYDQTVVDMDSAAIYKSQPNLQAVISFLADNIAQLPVKNYLRVSDTNRERTTDSNAAKILTHPNSDQTLFELIRASMSDFLLYGKFIWMTLEDPTSYGGWQIRLIPPTWVINYKGNSPFAPESIDIVTKTDGVLQNVPAENFIIFHNYDPTQPAGCTSPIEALKQTLTEQIEADRYRLSVWKNGGRMSAYITRPKDIAPWTPEQAKDWSEQFKAAYGKGGANAGGMPVLEDGMEIKSAQFSCREAQWADSKKFSREDVASVYHVNPSLIWHTDSQTYASAKDNARSLYSDTLMPLIRMVEERLNTFFLPRVGAGENEYVEFDMREKLRGSFEEQVQSLQSSVGAAYLTRNEARAMLNLPAIEGGDELVTPLNVLTGSQASPTDSDSTTKPIVYSVEQQKKSKSVHVKAKIEEKTQDKLTKTLQKFFERQKNAVLPKLGAKADRWWNEKRWNKELSEDLLEIISNSSEVEAKKYLRQLGIDPDIYNADLTQNYLETVAINRAVSINNETYKQLKSSDEPKEVFDNAINSRASKSGRALAASVAVFSLHECIQQAQAQGHNVKQATKTWIVTSDNPRQEHAEMDGETVGINEEFSNGARYPGDGANLDADQVCNCECLMQINN